MKILQIASLLPVPGLIHQNNYVLILCEHMKDLRQDIQFQFLRPSTYLPFINRKKWKNRNIVRKLKYYDINGVRINILPYVALASNEFFFAVSSVLFSIYYVLFQPNLFKNNDIVHAHYLFPDGMLAYRLKKKYGTPYILTVQNEQRLLNSKYARRQCTKIIHNANYIFCVNPGMKYTIIEKCKYNGAIKVLGLGINKAFYKHTINLDEKNAFKIITVAILYKLKNLENQIKAIKEVSKKHKIQYTIIGDGEQRDFLETLCAQLGIDNIVNIIPYMENSELPEILARHDLFLLASYKESWGKVYVEAMAVGLPVILTKNTGVYQFFKNRNAIHAVDPDNISAIAKTITSLIENTQLRKRMSIQAKELAAGFDWDSIAKQYLEVINQIE